MNQYKEVQLKLFSSNDRLNSKENLFWKKYQHPIIVKEFSSIQSISFDSNAPYDYLVTNSNKIQIYSGSSNKIKKTISRFKELVYSATFRSDGKLISSCDEVGHVHVYDANSKNILRTFKGHSRAVHYSTFSSLVNIISCSDDCTIRSWDVPTGEEITLFHEHTDYVRCISALSKNRDIFISGGYDHLIKLWDHRKNQSALTMNHEAPVEAVLLFPNSGTAVSAGGNTIRVWDLLAGGKELYQLSNHQKTITSLVLNEDCTKMFSGGLDHHVKIYDTATYKVLHGIKYTAPITSIGVSSQETHLAVGMSNGLLSILHRPSSKNKTILEKPINSNKSKFFFEKNPVNSVESVLLIKHTKKKHLTEYDAMMKRFQYSKALDKALNTSNPLIITSVLQEINHRGALKISLSARNEQTFQPLLSFILKNINDPTYSKFLLEIFHLLLDIYSSVIGESQEIDDLIVQLKIKLNNEIQYQKKMFELLGCLDVVLTAAL